MLIIPTEDFALTQCNCTHTVHLLILTKEPVCLTNGRWESCKLCHLLPIPTNSLSLSVSEDQVTQLTHEAPFLSRQFVLQVQLHRAVPAELVMAQLSCNLKVSCWYTNKMHSVHLTQDITHTDFTSWSPCAYLVSTLPYCSVYVHVNACATCAAVSSKGSDQVVWQGRKWVAVWC